MTTIKKYQPLLNKRETEETIYKVKDFFAAQLAERLQLMRVSAPIALLKGTGINDDLNGYERAVTFPIKDMDETRAEVVHSLAKWKRMRLKELEIQEGQGLYTNMHALRPDEVLSSIHSVFVDQWDWEKHIAVEQRSIAFLQSTVEKIYEAIKATEEYVHTLCPAIVPVLPSKITFIHAEDLLKEYPEFNAKERETAAARKYGAVFIIGIGGELANGKPHDSRAPDYDDWSTVSGEHKGLNGDIIVWNPLLESAFEISSMGIRVDKDALSKQLQIAGCEERRSLLFHQMLLDEQLPSSIGGGIGQSRLCMFLLRKAHIGEVQVSIWPESIQRSCKESKIELL